MKRKTPDPSPTPARRALVVLGMHRSGTSALARVLSLRGADLPAHLMSPNRGNTSGYWEPAPIVSFNDEVLDYFGTSWDDPFAAFQLPEPSQFPGRFQKRAQQLIDEEYGDSPLFILKDPRNCLLVGFWGGILARMGVQVHAIQLARPFSEVAASLQTRDRAVPAATVLLSVAYAVEAALYCESRSATVLHYEQLLDDWRGATDRVAAEQGLKWPRAGAFLDQEVADFLTPGTSRTHVLDLSPELRHWADTVWEWFCARSQGKPADMAQLHAIRQAMACAAQTYGPVVAGRRMQLKVRESALESAEAVAADRQREMLQAQALLAHAASERDLAASERDRLALVHGRHREETEQRILAYSELLTERDRLLGLYQNSRREGEAAAVESTKLMAERDQLLALQDQTQARLEHVQEAHSTLCLEAEGLRASALELADENGKLILERDRALSAYDGANTALHATELAFQRLAIETDGLRMQRASQAETIANLHGSIQEHFAELMATRDLLDAANARVEAMDADHDRITAELENWRAAVRQRELEIDRQREALARAEGLDLCRQQEVQSIQRELDHTRGELRRAMDGIDQLRASHSWRITAPLRSVVNASRNILQVSRKVLHRPRRLLALAPPDATESGHGPAPGPLEPAWVRRKHVGLRAFLLAEFGEVAAAQVLHRIDRFRLPLNMEEGRAAADASCTEAEARQWAGSLAERSAALPPLGLEPPDVSIVVPAYNQLPFTLACVDALLAQQSRFRFEILIGDDASNDATALAFAEPIARVVHVRHPGNLGFLRNCNATSAMARGRNIVFLNNDALVLPGWLDELLEVLEHNPSVGLVGSKLIYPDGRLQECGGIVWRDGSAWNFGRLDDPRKPEHNYLRGADFVSGASIALPTAVWRKLGGFDEYFAPAYAEDADLAFRVRAAGFYTLVQPLSQAIHFEGVTAGTDLGQGMKAHQVVNLRKLHERWRHALAAHRDNGQYPEFEKERDTSRRLLFIDHCTLTPNEDAGSLVAFEIMTSFRRFGYKVTFIPEDNFAHMGEDTRVLQRLGVEAIYHPAYSRMEQFLATRQDPFDAILLHRFTVGDRHLAELRSRFPDSKFIFLVCDLHYLRELREAELNGDPAAIARARKTRKRELEVAASCEAVIVYSEAERELLQAELPHSRILMFPLVHEPVATPTPLSGRDGVCFVGGFRHPPNADAIQWFADQVWPLVHLRFPQATLYIAGSHMTEAVKVLGRRPGVEIVGFVPDLEGFLSKRRVNVAPLRFGAGVKGKVAASLANGLPTVGTSTAAEGMLLTPGEDVMVADDAAEFADRVVELLTRDEVWQAQSEAGLRYARCVTSRACAEERLATILTSLDLPSR